MQGNFSKVQQKPINPGSPPIYYEDKLVEAIKKNDIKQIKNLLGAEQKGRIPPVNPSYQDSKGRNALHIAVEDGGSVEVINLLVKINIDVNAEDTQGYTPLHLAITLDKRDLAKELFDSPGVNVKTRHKKGRSTLDSAISKRNDEIILLLLNSCPYIMIFFSRNNVQRTEIYEKLLNIALERDNVELFKKIIVNVYRTTNHETLENLPKNTKIKDFLSYRPGKRFEDIQFNILQKECSSATLEDLFYDQACSSTATSSESTISENEKYQVLNENIGENNKILFRGFHFSPDHLHTTAERIAVITSDHDKPVYSLATVKLAEDKGKTLGRADELVKAYFELLKITPDKPELTENYKERHRQVQYQTKNFDTLYHRFVHAYVNPGGYDDLFNKGGARRNFNFFCNNNPTLSTTPACSVSAEYATGNRITGVARYYPKVRKSTGQLKHRRLGYVEVYAISEEYYKKYAMDVDQLKVDKKISIAHNQSFNKEVIIESSIPKEFILGYQLFSLPSFNGEWSDSIEKRYGLNKPLYDLYSKELLNKWNDRKKILEKIVVKVTKYQAEKMTASIEANAAKSGKNENKANKRKKVNFTSTASQIAKSDEVQDSNLSVQSKKKTSREEKKGNSTTSKSSKSHEAQDSDSSENNSVDEALLQLGILASLSDFTQKRNFYSLNRSGNFQYIAGNCLFDAIAYQDEKKRKGENIRKIAVEKIKISDELRSRIKAGINAEELRCIGGDETYSTIQEYLTCMGKDQTWGTHIEMVALSRVLERPIVYITPGNLYDDIIEEKTYRDNKPIFLNYVGENHYEPLSIPTGVDFKKIIGNIRSAIASRKENADKDASKEKIPVQLSKKTSVLDKRHAK